MNFDAPTDLSPLSYGCGLALGLALLIGLPAAPTPVVAPNAHPPATPPPPHGHSIAFR